MVTEQWGVWLLSDEIPGFLACPHRYTNPLSPAQGLGQRKCSAATLWVRKRTSGPEEPRKCRATPLRQGLGSGWGNPFPFTGSQARSPSCPTAPLSTAIFVKGKLLAHCGERGGCSCNLHFLYVFLSHPLLGKNSWKLQPGTFLITNRLLPTTMAGQRVRFNMAEGPGAACRL